MFFITLGEFSPIKSSQLFAILGKNKKFIIQSSQTVQPRSEITRYQSAEPDRNKHKPRLLTALAHSKNTDRIFGEEDQISVFKAYIKCERRTQTQTRIKSYTAELPTLMNYAQGYRSGSGQGQVGGALVNALINLQVL